MKVLGIMFHKNLAWTSQVSNTITKTNRMFHGLKRPVKPEQMRQAVTAFYFSVLYYGMEALYHRGLSFRLKRKIRAAHYMP